MAVWRASTGWPRPEKPQPSLASSPLRTMLTCQAAAAAVTVVVAAAAAAVSQRRRAPVRTWPAVNRGTLPSPCCSPTITSSAEVGQHAAAPHLPALPPPWTGDMGRTCELYPQLGPALKLQNMRGSGEVRDPHSQSLGHHCQWGFHSACLYYYANSSTPSSLSSSCLFLLGRTSVPKCFVFQRKD